MGSGRRRPRPGARPRARAVALDWGIFSQHFWGASIQPLQRIERRPAKLDLTGYPYLPGTEVRLTRAADYATLLQEQEA